MPLADVNDVYTDLMTSVFSTTIAAKAWLATAAVILAVVQVLTDTRVAIHSLAGSFVYGVFTAKMLIVRDGLLPGWALPVAGATMASTLGVLWLTSSLWYFTEVEF